MFCITTSKCTYVAANLPRRWNILHIFVQKVIVETDDNFIVDYKISFGIRMKKRKTWSLNLSFYYAFPNQIHIGFFYIYLKLLISMQ